MRETVVAVVGPTAVGKSALSVEIAKAFKGEVISGDSMQIYQGMDIGTAKIIEEEKQNIPHHMIDIRKPGDAFSVSDFKALVENKIKAITARGNIPIIAGGSGLYIQAILYDYSFSGPERDANVTDRLEQSLKEKGAKAMHEELSAIDSVQAANIHPNNHRRVIRALEVYETTGETMTERENKQSEKPVYHTALIGLEMEREMLYERINHRVDSMIDHGLIEEAKTFYDMGLAHSQAMKGIGYKEFLPYFRGEQPLNETIRQLKQNSRRYAKRQYTWFKNKLPVDWYSITPMEETETFQIILRNLAGKLQEK